MKKRVMSGLGLLLLLNGVHGYGAEGLSYQVIAIVDRFIQSTRELNVAMMMVAKGQKDTDARSAAIHALKRMGCLEYEDE